MLLNAILVYHKRHTNENGKLRFFQVIRTGGSETKKILTISKDELWAVSFHLLILCTPLQRHYTANSKQVFAEMKLRSLVPNFHSQVFVSDLYIATIDAERS
jgi:hypothetical protein